MKKELFLQKNYSKENPKLAEEGCYFFCLCYIAKAIGIRTKDFNLDSKEDILKFFKFCISRAWAESDGYILSPLDILNNLTGSKWSLMENALFGIKGKPHFLPACFPEPLSSVAVSSYVNLASKNTHFAVEQHGKEIFNPLGDNWKKEKEGIYFFSDKRVFLKS